MDAEPSSPTPPATPKHSGTPYWMEFTRTLAVAVVGGASLWISILTYRMQRDNGRLQIETGRLQIVTQQATLALQREIAAAQLAGNAIAYLGCDSGERQEIALALVSASAPQHVREITPALLNCRSKRLSADRLNELGSISEIRARFRQHLENAEEFFRTGFKEDAAQSYLQACDWIPAGTPIDAGVLNSARAAFNEQRYAQAADLFSRVFRNVSTF